MTLCILLKFEVYLHATYKWVDGLPSSPLAPLFERRTKVSSQISRAPALGKRTAHAFAHARLAGMSRDLVPRECTQLCLGQPELPGIRIGDHAIWKFNKGQESPCSSQTFGCHDEVMVSSLCMDCKVWAMMDCKYGLWIQGL